MISRIRSKNDTPSECVESNIPSQDLEQKEYVTLETINNEIKSLIGIAPIKKQLMEINNALNNIKIRSVFSNCLSTINIHFIIEGGEGAGKEKVANILTKILCHNGYSKKIEPLIIDKRMVQSFRPIHEALKECPRGNVIYISKVEDILPNPSSKFTFNNSFGSLWGELLQYSKDNIFIIGIHQSYSSQLNSLVD